MKPEISDCPPIVVFGGQTGNCRRVTVALEEAGVAYRAQALDLRAGEQRSVEHLQRNPAGKVPTLVARNASGPTFVISQSNAILLYIADLVPGSIVPVEHPARALVMERFFHFSTEVIGLNGSAFMLKRGGHTLAADQLEAHSVDALLFASRFLSDGPFMAGDSFSLADIAGLTIANALADRIEWNQHAALCDWRARVMSRPAVQRGMAAFDPVS